mmetsp:Transcript_16499/g.34043  ORF Transcript_16499/g.34043 Transcript_16499/m.34043 type:complete len:243 (-) Transcript_16499:3578-4306(-)
MPAFDPPRDKVQEPVERPPYPLIFLNLQIIVNLFSDVKHPNLIRQKHVYVFVPLVQCRPLQPLEGVPCVLLFLHLDKPPPLVEANPALLKAHQLEISEIFPGGECNPQVLPLCRARQQVEALHISAIHFHRGKAQPQAQLHFALLPNLQYCNTSDNIWPTLEPFHANLSPTLLDELKHGTQLCLFTGHEESPSKKVRLEKRRIVPQKHLGHALVKQNLALHVQAKFPEYVPNLMSIYLLLGR